jgi:Uncharacterised nucleotidyltransferase
VTARRLHGSFWPQERHQALLRVTVGARQQAVSRWHALQPIDVRALESGCFCLLPLLHERLSEVGAQDPQASLLLGTYRSTWYRNQLVLDRASALASQLRGHGVEPFVVGGAAMALRWYPRLGGRPIAQLEVVVDPVAAEPARQAAIAAQWLPAGRSRTFSRFVDEGARTLIVHEGAPPLLAGPLGCTRGYAVLRDAATPFDVGNETVLAFQPADELLLCAAHGARTATPPTIQWLVDIVQILTSPERPDPALVASRARIFRVAEPLREAIAYLIGTLEVPGLDEYAHVLAAEHVSGRDRMAYRLGGARIGLVGGLSLTLSAHLRATAEDPPWRVAVTLPRHLQQTWETRTLYELPAAAWRRFRRVARG